MSRDLQLMVVAGAALLFGCTGPTKPVPLSDYCPKPEPQAVCAGWSPIITHADDLKLLDPRTIQEIDAHNTYGMVKGCWAPKG